jgi:hypothetical protein
MTIKTKISLNKSVKVDENEVYINIIYDISLL